MECTLHTNVNRVLYCVFTTHVKSPSVTIDPPLLSPTSRTRLPLRITTLVSVSMRFGFFLLHPSTSHL